MHILGVESTAHTFGIGIITDKGDILANVKDSYTSPDKGMIPHEIAQHHQKVAESVVQKAFTEAKLSWKDISFIAYSAGPGLDPALWAGYNLVKQWSKSYNKKIVGVNHCAAHLSIGKMYNKLKDPCYLYVSGVNTQVIVEEGGKYRVMGETLDIGLGNMLDKFGRIIGLGFPAGPQIEELAKKGKYIEMPYVVKGMDVEYSGIVTHAVNLYKKGAKKEDLCFSIQETIFSMLTEVAERAMAHTGKKELLLIGGVAANKRLIEMLTIMCRERKAKFYVVPVEYSGDQGVMIAWTGILEYKRNKKYYSNLDIKKVDINSNWRIDD